MNQVCRRTCQVRVDGYITLVKKGEVVDYAGKHPSLEPIDKDVDFSKASREELLIADWALKDLRQATRELYGAPLKASSNDTVATQVDAFLDARYRAIITQPAAIPE